MGIEDQETPEEPSEPDEPEPTEGPPAPVMETGRIQILVGLDEDGAITRSWGINGMTPYEAVGHLEVLSGLIKNIEMGSWAKGMRG